MSEPIYQCFVTDDDDEKGERMWMDVDQSVYDELTKRNDVRGRLVYSQEHVAALSAVVERQREALTELVAHYTEPTGITAPQIMDDKQFGEFLKTLDRNRDDVLNKAKEALSLTPATALRLHDAEVLEKLADEWFMWHEHSDHERLRAEAKRIRAEAGRDGE